MPIIWGVCSLERARRDQVRNTCPCRGKTGSLCFLPVQIKYSNWHSTTGCEGSGLDSSVWKAAFHPISCQWVLGVFMVTQLWHVYLSCLSYRRYVSLIDRIWLSIFIFFVWSVFTWFLCMCNIDDTLSVTLHMTFSVGRTSTAAGHWTWHTSRALMCSDWWDEHCF